MWTELYLPTNLYVEALSLHMTIFRERASRAIIEVMSKGPIGLMFLGTARLVY